MRSFLLEQMARFLVPMAMLFALSLLVKGHDEPGGGFVAVDDVVGRVEAVVWPPARIGTMPDVTEEGR